MTSLASYIRTSSRSRDRDQNFGKDDSLNYLLAFTAFGIFVSVLAVALGLDAAAW